MALNKAILKTQIETAVKAINLTDPATDVPGAIAQIMADAIDAYVKTAVVTISAGIPVSTTGSAVAQTGATTGPGTGTLS